MIKYTIHSKCKHWPRRVNKISKIIKKVLTYKNEMKFVSKIDYYCNIILTNDKSIKGLNKRYTNKNKATDVLTFVSEINYKNNLIEKHCDIYFSIETIKLYAKKNNINFYDHFTHLIIHSFLHINNFVHKKIKDYLIMQKKEIFLLKKLNINNPYLIK